MKKLNRLVCLTASAMFMAGLVIPLLSSVQAAAFASGDGSTGNPYQIATCQDLQDVKNNLTASYVLTNNIDCTDTVNWNSGAGFEPIAMTGPAFTGQLGGNKHTISGLYINRGADTNIALFGQTGSGATITNLKLRNGSVSGGGKTASLIGSATDTMVDRVSSDLSVSGTGNDVGGLIGATTGVVTISKSYSIGNVSGTHDFVGGLIGHGGDGLVVNDTYSQSNVTGIQNVGGFIGGIDSWGLDTTISYAYSSGAVTGNENVGGFIGLFWNGYLTGIFSTSHVTPNGATLYGALFGYWDQMDGAGGESMFYDATASGVGILCDNDNSWSDDQGWCTAVNQDGTQPDFFKAFPPNGPIDNWNIDMIWLAQNGSYPLLWTFLTVPRAPTIVGADPAKTSVDLMLSLPIESQNASITDITVQYRVHGTSSWSTFVHDPFTNGPVTVTGLTPGNNYDFQIAAQNVVGTSAFSESYTVATLSDPAPTPDPGTTTSSGSGTTTVTTSSSPRSKNNLVQQLVSGELSGRDEGTDQNKPAVEGFFTAQPQGSTSAGGSTDKDVQGVLTRNRRVYIGLALLAFALFLVLIGRRRQRDHKK